MKKRVLVTGSSRGIGRAVAVNLAEAGFQVVLHFHRDTAAVDETKSQLNKLGQEASILQFDVSNADETRKVLEEDMAQSGAYYGVVCNAGLSRDAAFPSMTNDDWGQVIRTNLDGFYNVLHPVVMPMISRRAPGRIVVVSSVSGLIGNRGQVNYSASKAGVIGAAKSLAIELAKRNITVNCVAPGLIRTDMTAGVAVEKIQSAIPMRRCGEPEEVAAVVGFLMSDAGSYITRQVITVDGGLSG